MAKAISFIGNFKGKVGNIVGFQLRNSNNAVTQGIRAYVSEVSNPKTEPQAIQRMKMAPAVNFYRQLSDILDNAWQGQKYGTRSRQYYMGLAMRQITGIPFIPKGEKRFFPGNYPVSQGSLASINIQQIDNEGLLKTTISIQYAGTNWGEFSQSVINHNFGIKNGDRITILQVFQTAQGEFIPTYTWVRLNTLSDETVGAVCGNSNVICAYNTGYVKFRIIDAQGQTPIGGAIIMSRLVLNGRYPQWLRSNAVMYCSQAYLTQFMGTEAYEIALASYMDNTDYSSDWYLNLGLESQPTPIAGGDSNLYIVSREAIVVPSLDGNDYGVGIANMSDGSKRALRNLSSGGYIVKWRNGRYELNTSNFATEVSLHKIQAVEPDVTGWLTVQVEVNDDDIPIING